jgi:hypothetical protein
VQESIVMNKTFHYHSLRLPILPMVLRQTFRIHRSAP